MCDMISWSIHINHEILNEKSQANLNVRFLFQSSDLFSKALGEINFGNSLFDPFKIKFRASFTKEG